MRSKVFCFSLAAVVFLTAGDGQAAAPGLQQSTVQKNVQQLLKSNACPACDLAGVDLSRAQLNGANLEGANLAGAMLSLTDLSGANLKKANLQEANLGGADLAHADLEGANLTGAVLDGAFLHATKMKGRIVNRLVHAEQTQGDEARATRGPASGEVADKERAKLAEGTHSKKNVPMADAIVPKDAGRLKAAADTPKETTEKAQAVVAEEASAQPAGRESRIGRTPPRDDSASQPAKQAQSTSARVGEEKQHRVEEMASLPAATEKEVAAAEPAKKEPVTVNAAKQGIIDRLFHDKRCVGCDLAQLDLAGRDLEGFDLERASLQGCNLRRADLSSANLRGANFRNSQLQEADLRKTDLYRADFSGADLTGARLEKALVDATNFTDAVGVNLEGVMGAK